MPHNTAETGSEKADTLYQMGCLFRKRAEYSQAAEHFTEAARSYATVFGPTDKRVSEANKRADAMHERMRKKQAGGSSSRSKIPSSAR